MDRGQTCSLSTRSFWITTDKLVTSKKRTKLKILHISGGCKTFSPEVLTMSLIGCCLVFGSVKHLIDLQVESHHNSQPDLIILSIIFCG